MCHLTSERPLETTPSSFSRRRAFLLLAAYGVFLFLTNPWVTTFEDEAAFIDQARKPVTETLALFAAGGAHAHPPLPDILLHFWLLFTGESFSTLRIPSIAFYCLMLWTVAATAELLWRQGWTALVLGMSWPAGYLLGRPAGWYSLSMLALAAVVWFYCKRNLIGLALGGILLVNTNYFGWVFLAVIASDFIIHAPSWRELRRFYLVIGLIGLGFLPLVGTFLRTAGAPLHPWTLTTTLKLFYFAHSLLGSEMAAPWTWPGMLAAGAGACLLALAVRQPQSWRVGLWLAAAVTIAMATGVLNGSRMSMFAPWLLLFLTPVVGLARTRVAAVLVGLAFAMGWLGIVTGRFPGTFRYLEPWAEVAREVVEISKPGDAVIAAHPSFFFYLSYLLPSNRGRGPVAEPVTVAGRTIASVSHWREASGSTPRIIYVRSVLMSYLMSPDEELLQQGAQWKLEREIRYLRDPGIDVKRKFFPGTFQPEWRIQIFVWRKP